MAIVPKITQPMPQWADKAIKHLHYVAGLLAQNGMEIQANGLDRNIAVIRRYVQDHQQNAAQGGESSNGR